MHGIPIPPPLRPPPLRTVFAEIVHISLAPYLLLTFVYRLNILVQRLNVTWYRSFNEHLFSETKRGVMSVCYALLQCTIVMLWGFFGQTDAKTKYCYSHSLKYTTFDVYCSLLSGSVHQDLIMSDLTDFLIPHPHIWSQIHVHRGNRHNVYSVYMSLSMTLMEHWQNST